VDELREERGGRLRPPWFVAFLSRRLIWALVTLLIFLTATFFFVQVWVPYTWATQFLQGGAGAFEAAMEAAGLNRPLLERYADFMTGLAGGDLGTSFNGEPVIDLIGNALPVTLTVFITGTVIGWVVGELLGRIGTWSRRPLSGAALSVLDAREAMGLPTDSLVLWRDAVAGREGALDPADVRWLIALGLCAALVVALIVRAHGRRHQLPIVEGLALPLSFLGVGVGIWLSDLGPHALDLLYRADITATTGRGTPALAIAGVIFLAFGQVMLVMHAGMEAEKSEDYVLTGRAKGLTERAVRDKHVARNVLAPVLAGSFLTFPTVLAGMIIVEYELEMDGLSSVLFDAIEFQDIPVIMGVMVVLGLIGVGFRLATDFAIAVLDPRQRRGRA
jgi:peptide/nickel transport system permease protein